MTTQGSLKVIQKEDIVNKKTPNFSFSERHLAFTEKQQDFLRELGFTNSKEGKIMGEYKLYTLRNWYFGEFGWKDEKLIRAYGNFHNRPGFRNVCAIRFWSS